MFEEAMELEHHADLCRSSRSVGVVGAASSSRRRHRSVRLKPSESATARRIVVFPEPDDPMIATISPRDTCRLTLERMPATAPQVNIDDENDVSHGVGLV
jgi:hypothetical protein